MKNNFKSLEEFSVVLTNCRNALLGTTFGQASLHNAETIDKIARKMPLYMQDRWLRTVDDVMNRQNRAVKFDDLVDYVKKEARIMSNPLFGKTAIGNTEKRSFRNSSGITRKINVHRVGMEEKIEEKGEEVKKSLDKKTHEKSI